MDFTRLTESDEYRRQREELRVAELDLIDQVERVAALRRTLPADTVVDDYELIDVASGDHARLSELFSAPDRTLVLYHFMYGKAQTSPVRCARCGSTGTTRRPPTSRRTSTLPWSPPPSLRPSAPMRQSRGWRNLRLLSAGDTTFKYDLGSEEADGTQTEWISVFTRGVTAPCVTPTPRARNWPATDASAASTCSARSGTSLISRQMVGATGTPP